ncbi:presqualene diphosphate synthase HpnD [Thiobacter aerophilum]|uniref:Presqualene diphosphate synthase HpnD n=1 Tax=Thiobacter aerophilum TaxID=3121275 RepID=A0ABV0EBH0_9BURK
MTPDQYCQEKAAQSGSSFYYSFLFLPKEKRAAITALYAFCREVDDAVDDCTDPQVARIKLAWWREELAKLYLQKPRHPVTRALLPAVKRHDLPREQFEEIIDGMEMDLQHNRYPDFKSLKLYCYRVASVVGQLSAILFGVSDRHTLKYAHDLGLAFQLTNIIRDVGEDARRNRIYLPLDELARFGVSEQDILARRHTPAFRGLMAFQVERAREFYARALAQLPMVDRRNQRPGLIMAAIYQALLTEIERDDFQVLNRRTALTPLRKFWLAWKTWIK